MSTRTWHKGPPPFPGWWNASKFRDEKSWRFHNGDDWSCTAEPEDSMQEVRRSAGLLDDYRTNTIEWTDYWPENARVPRVDPRSKTMTDIETSKALALSIGYMPEHVRVVDWGNGPFVQVLFDGSWCGFDYRQPHTIFQIAERYNCFPSHEFKFSFIRNELYWKACKGGYVATADTAAEAIALAVIRGSK